MLMDFLLIGSLTPEELVKRTSMGGREHLDAALARGRGVIMAVSHMGSLDMAGADGGASGHPIAPGAAKVPRSPKPGLFAAPPPLRRNMTQIVPLPPIANT